MLRGDVYYLDLSAGEAKAGGARGRRPALVVSSDAMIRNGVAVHVMLGVDAREISQDYPSNVRVSAKESGLSFDVVFLGYQLHTLTPEQLEELASRRGTPAGRLSNDRMDDVDAALRAVLGL